MTLTRTSATEHDGKSGQDTAKRGSRWSLPVLNRFAPPQSADPAAATAEDAVGELAPWEMPGAEHAPAIRAGVAPALPGAPTTTRQAEILNTAVIGPPTGTRGIASARDVLSRTVIAHDPITAYNETPRLVTSPNSVVLGDIGSGKSSFIKTVFIARPLILARRRAVVFDKKDRGGEGEYAQLARAYGAEPITFTPNGTGTKLNVLDAMISHGSGVGGTARLLAAIARLANDGNPLTRWEQEALRAALHATLNHTQDGHTATLSDVLPQLPAVVNLPDYEELSPAARDELHRAGLSVQFTFNSLLEVYGGLLEGETSKDLDLAHKLTVWDISQLPDDGPGVPIVMAIGHMWLLGRLRYDRGWATTCVYEEGWHIAAGPSAELARANQKLSRSVGLGNVFAFHKGTDIPENSPGMAMVQEAQSIYVYRQSRPEDAAWCQRTFNFHPETTEQIVRLPDGHHFFKYGTHPETQAQHIRSGWEIGLTDTDEALNAARHP